MYPITAQNLASFPGKVLTATNTLSISGTISFRTGGGMQGVNVVARPLDANGDPLYQYTVTAASGVRFAGKRGNPATGFADADGVPYARWGSDDTALQGYFDLSGIPLPPQMASVSYQITFESIDPLFIMGNSVGPYIDGQDLPSRTLEPVTIADLAAGSSKIEGGITPKRPVVLSWPTFTDAANEAGISRRYGGIHFRRADLDGRLLGRLVAERAWKKSQDYFNGVPSSPRPIGNVDAVETAKK